ncbi:hypothetical protein [Microbacterium sp. P02]|uniref:hypothetical protein n=1 Tax=Microbacterium sp. P02 TaxID=3366260 RepID=UPI00366F8D6E
MSDDEVKELKELRARAYGPRADIAGDSVALRRLTELEQRSPGLPSDLSARSAAAAPFTPSPGQAKTLARHSPQAQQHDGPLQFTPPSAPATGRRVKVVWIGLLIACVAASTSLTAFATTAAISPAPLIAGTEHTASIALDEGFSWPAMYPQNDARGFSDFLGLTAVASQWDTDGGARQECLSIYETENIDPNSDAYAGGFFGCGAGAFPAAVTVPVENTLPDPLREAFPEGTTLQFVLNNDTVEVYTDKK